MDSAGQGVIEMSHEFHVIHIVAAEIALPVRVVEVAGKQREIREAAGERMPANIDDFCVWQDQVNEARAPEIERVLVHEKGSRELPPSACALEIFFPELP